MQAQSPGSCATFADAAEGARAPDGARRDSGALTRICAQIARRMGATPRGFGSLDCPPKPCASAPCTWLSTIIGLMTRPRSSTATWRTIRHLGRWRGGHLQLAGVAGSRWGSCGARVGQINGRALTASALDSKVAREILGPAHEVARRRGRRWRTGSISAWRQPLPSTRPERWPTWCGRSLAQTPFFASGPFERRLPAGARAQLCLRLSCALPLPVAVACKGKSWHISAEGWTSGSEWFPDIIVNDGWPSLGDARHLRYLCITVDGSPHVRCAPNVRVGSIASLANVCYQGEAVWSDHSSDAVCQKVTQHQPTPEMSDLNHCQLVTYCIACFF